jgi:hypothetical protein
MDLGLRCLGEHKLSNAADHFKKSASKGDRDGAFQYAMLLPPGPERVIYLTQAADAGHDLAAYRLGVLYSDGAPGVAKNPLLCFKYLTQSTAPAAWDVLANKLCTMQFDGTCTDAAVTLRADASRARHGAGDSAIDAFAGELLLPFCFFSFLMTHDQTVLRSALSDEQRRRVVECVQERPTTCTQSQSPQRCRCVHCVDLSHCYVCGCGSESGFQLTEKITVPCEPAPASERLVIVHCEGCDQNARNAVALALMVKGQLRISTHHPLVKAFPKMQVRYCFAFASILFGDFVLMLRVSERYRGSARTAESAGVRVCEPGEHGPVHLF